MNLRLSSLTIFFPFYNDAGTVKKMLDQAYEYGSLVTNDLEVIALNGGNSKDNTYQEILKFQKLNPSVKIVNKKDNVEGYAVIKHGLYSSTKDFVFYTDGDAQYSLKSDFLNLIKKQNDTNADVVNGHKKDRKDNIFRILFGFLYATFSRVIFKSPITDIDCDFRLIRTSILKRFKLESHDASILPELVLKLKLNGANFSEIPVSHFPREYGKSNYTAFSLFKEKLAGDFKLYIKMRKEIKNIDINLFEFTLSYLKNSENFISSFLRIDNFKFIKFGLVGVSSVILHFIFFNIFMLLTNLNTGLITIVSDQLPILTSYILNNNYTFKKIKDVSSNRKHPTRFIKYWSIIMISTVIHSIIITSGIYIFGDTILIANIFFIAGVIIAMIWNYYFHSTLIWKASIEKGR